MVFCSFLVHCTLSIFAPLVFNIFINNVCPNKSHVIHPSTSTILSLSYSSFTFNTSFYLYFILSSSRFDGHLIDARNITVDHKNPYAVGHKINHIPPFGVPNVVQVPFDFTDDPFGLDCFPVELRKYIPNKLFQERTMLGSPDRYERLLSYK